MDENIIKHSHWKYIPNYVKEHIWSFVPDEEKQWVCKKTYNKMHVSFIMDEFSNFHTYIKNVIRNDYSFIFKTFLEKKFVNWYSMKNWIYKNSTFVNYAIFLKWLSMKYKSTKCYNLLKERIPNNVNNKKLYKNIRTKNNIWSN